MQHALDQYSISIRCGHGYSKVGIVASNIINYHRYMKNPKKQKKEAYRTLNTKPT